MCYFYYERMLTVNGLYCLFFRNLVVGVFKLSISFNFVLLDLCDWYQGDEIV